MWPGFGNPQPPLGSGQNGGGNALGRIADTGGGSPGFTPLPSPGQPYRGPNKPASGGTDPYNSWNNRVGLGGSGLVTRSPDGTTTSSPADPLQMPWLQNTIHNMGEPGPAGPTQQQLDQQAQQGQYDADQAASYAAINQQLGGALPQPGTGQAGANQAIAELNRQEATGDFTGLFNQQQMSDWQYALDAGAISDALMRQLKTMPPEQASQIAMNKVKEMNLRPGGNAYQWFG